MKFNAAEISRFAPFPLVSREIDKNKIKIEWKIQKRFSFLQAYPASSSDETVHVGMSRQEEWRYAWRYAFLTPACPAVTNSGTPYPAIVTGGSGFPPVSMAAPT